MSDCETYVNEVERTLRNLELAQVERFLSELQSAYTEGRAVYLIGNGGSAANASHFAQDLAKAALPDFETAAKRFRVLSLADNIGFITALANDIGYERVFDLQLRQFAEQGDILVAISGSGYSPNIIRAAEYAREIGMTVIGLTAMTGGKLLGLSDIAVHVPCDSMCQSEAVHAIIFHMVVDLLRERLGAS